jgi:hypothetical protein
LTLRIITQSLHRFRAVLRVLDTVCAEIEAS